MAARTHGWAALVVALAAFPLGAGAKPKAGGKPPEPPAAPSKPAAEAAPPADPAKCLDEELRRAGLNRYGDQPDTMYAGGTPLFDESTGRRSTRREYVAKKRPDLVAKCPEK
jgi:hypothetical protein